MPASQAVTPARIAAIAPDTTSVLARVLGTPAASGSVLARVLQGIAPLAARRLAPEAIKAAKETGVPASVLLAVSGQESAYGTNRNTSSAGARGAGQFIPTTGAYIAKKYGVNPFSYGKQGLAATGYYLKELGFQKDPQAALSAYSGGYAASAYNNPILAQAKKFHQLGLDRVSGVSSRAKGGPYVYPFSKGITIGRTDEGIDPSGPGVIRTIGKAKYLGTGGAGWPTEGGSGTGPVYKILKGPQKGKRVYTYEGITPRSGLTPGQTLRKGAPIARSTGTSFETGYALGRAKGFQPVASSNYSEGDVTRAGTAFGKFVASTKSGGSYPTSIGSGVSFGGGGAGALGTSVGSSSLGAALSGASPTQARQVISQLMQGGGAGASGGDFATSLLQALLPQGPQPGGLQAQSEQSQAALLAQSLGVAKPKRRLPTR